MAWDVAAYAIAIAAIVVAGAAAAAAATACRSLRKLQKTAQRLEVETAKTLSECRELAAEARSAATACKIGLQGAQTLAEGARALGAAAEHAAHNAIRLTKAWHDRLRPKEAAAEQKQADGFKAEAGNDWLELTGFVRRFLRGRLPGFGSDRTSHYSGANADASQGE